LIVTDYRLCGDRNGVEAPRHVTAYLEPRIAVAVMTGDTATEPLRDAEEAGCVLLHKPVRPDRLHHLLRTLKPVDNQERQP
jgi:CheY-like chemotaxis protein